MSTGTKRIQEIEDPFLSRLTGEPRDISDYLGALGVHTHQPQRPYWRGCSKSAQLLSARLGHARARSRGPSQLGRWRAGWGKNATYQVWGLDFGQGWQQTEAGQRVSPTEDGQYGQGLRREWGEGKRLSGLGSILAPASSPAVASAD